MVKTFTHTWTQTRLETVQDQFRYLLYYGGIAEDAVDKVVDAIAEKAVAAVGIYGYKRVSRLIEVELRVDWIQHGQLTLQVPTIHGDLPGWVDKQSPETRVAGRRFAQIVKNQGLSVGWWIELASNVTSNQKLRQSWNRRLGISDSAQPTWEDGHFDERPESFLDLAELGMKLRRARQR